MLARVIQLRKHTEMSNHFQGHHRPIAGSKEEPLYALGARFETPEALVQAVDRLRVEGVSLYECFTPYPIHGLAEAMRLPKSILSLLVLGGGVSAVLIALSMELIPSCIIYPLVVDGKPLNLLALPQYIPIVVALTLMIGAITAVTGMILLGGMPQWNNPMFAWDLFAKDASRGFFIAIEARDRKFSTSALTELLHELGAGDITAIHQEASVKK
jgi:hypothetical protein